MDNFVTIQKTFSNMIGVNSKEDNINQKQTADTNNVSTMEKKSLDENVQIEDHNCEQRSADSTDELTTFGLANANDKNRVYRREIMHSFDNVLEQMRDIIQLQKTLNSSVDQLRNSTLQLGNNVKTATMYEGIKKLISLWRIINHSTEEINQYYVELLFDALCCFGVEAIIPQSGDSYQPEFHQKEDSSSASEIINRCEKYNWGWKMDDIVIQKAVVLTESNEETNNESSKL